MTSLSRNDKNIVLIRLSSSSFAKVDFMVQSRPQKTFSMVWALEAEINNGGFSQYFFNRSAETVPWVAEALVSLGALHAADICQRAIEVAFPLGLPSDPEAISAEAANFTEEVLEQLEGLDRELFAYPDDLTVLMFDDVAAHRDDFGPVSDSQ
jgi:Domain of unknown function (DUF4375)